MTMDLLLRCQQDFGQLSTTPAGAFEKIEARLPEFRAAHWSEKELYHKAPESFGHHGLIWRLYPNRQIDQIAEWWCTLYRPDLGEDSPRLRVTKGAPLPTLVALHGRQVLLGIELGFNSKLFTEDDLKGVC